MLPKWNKKERRVLVCEILWKDSIRRILKYDRKIESLCMNLEFQEETKGLFETVLVFCF
jgi:hypothetical protein